MSSNTSIHENFIKSMEEMTAQFAKAGIKLQLPPTSTKTLGTRYTKIDYGKLIQAEIPFDEKYCNPIGIYQGGFLCGVLDEVYGPLTYMACGRPVVTLEMSTSFIRPFTKKDELIIVEATVVDKTKSLLILRAEARNREGKLIATSTSHSMILSDEQIKQRGA